jgi:hypothetical protein
LIWNLFLENGHSKEEILAKNQAKGLAATLDF